MTDIRGQSACDADYTNLRFVLLLGALFIFHTGLQNSLSYYYYTGMRNYFVGALCVIGSFLFSYKGYETIDDLFGYLGCAFAIGVALFPTNPQPIPPGYPAYIGYLHWSFALLLFVILIFFCLFLFTKTNPHKPPTRRKLWRNKIYRICGYIMILCILGIGFYDFILKNKPPRFFHLPPVFVLESVAVMVFGFSWLLKGETLMRDQAE